MTKKDSADPLQVLGPGPGSASLGQACTMLEICAFVGEGGDGREGEGKRMVGWHYIKQHVD